MPIKSFKHKGLKIFFETGLAKGIQAKHFKKLGLVLDLLDSAITIDDMNFPGSNLHQLKGNRQQQWSVKISGNWRVTFVFSSGDIFEVDYLDYH